MADSGCELERTRLERETFPKTVLSVGGRFRDRDQGETANTQISVMDYGDTQLIIEVRGLNTKGFQGYMIGNIAYLEAGTIAARAVTGEATSSSIPRGRPRGSRSRMWRRSKTRAGRPEAL